MPTINGRSIKEVLRDLEAPSSVVKENYGGFPYIPIEEYEKRLIEVLGTEHYNVESFPIAVNDLESSTKQPLLSVVCKITILDDDYNPIFFRKCNGGNELTSNKTTGKYDGLKNSLFSAEQDAFKNACKKMNLFNLGMVSTSSPEGEAPVNSTSPKEKQTFILYVAGEIARADNYSEKKPSFTLTCLTEEGEKIEVAFLSNNIARNQERFNEFAARASSSSKFLFKITGFENIYKGRKQIVFNAFL